MHFCNHRMQQNYLWQDFKLNEMLIGKDRGRGRLAPITRVVVSVSRRTNVSFREKLSTSRSREADVSDSSWSWPRPFTSRAQDHAIDTELIVLLWCQCINSFLMGMQMAPYTQCERALDVVSLCCSYCCSSY